MRKKIAQMKRTPVKKYQAGGRVRGDSEGRAAEDMELQRAERTAQDQDRIYYDYARPLRDRMLAQLRNWEANSRAEDAAVAAGRAEDRSGTKEYARRRQDVLNLRREIERGGAGAKKPAPFKKGGKVSMKKGKK